MPKLPRITGKTLLGVLEKNGFFILRVRGSHYFLENLITQKRTTIPLHGNEILRPGILLSILRDIDWEKEDLLEKL